MSSATPDQATASVTSLVLGREIHQSDQKVRVATVSPDGSSVVLGVDDGRVFVYSLDTGDLVRADRRLHRKAVWGADFSSDGALLFTASWDKSMVISDFRTGAVRRRFRAPDIVNDVAAYPDDAAHAVVASKAGAFFYNYITNKVDAQVNHPGVLSIAFVQPRENSSCDAVTPEEQAGDAKAAAGDQGDAETAGGAGEIVSADAAVPPRRRHALLSCWDGSVFLWDTAADAVLWTLTVSSGPVWRVRWQPQSQGILTADNDGVVALHDVTGRTIWSVRANKQANTIRCVGAGDDDHDATAVIVGSHGENSKLTLLDARSGTELAACADLGDSVYSIAPRQRSAEVIIATFCGANRVSVSLGTVPTVTTGTASNSTAE